MRSNELDKGGVMGKLLSELEVAEILSEFWSQIAYFAYCGYLKAGRGAAGIEEAVAVEPEGTLTVSLLYAVYDFAAGKPEPAVAALLGAYDPDREVVVQFVTESENMRTLRLATAPGADIPAKIYLVQTLIAEDREKFLNSEFWQKMDRIKFESATW
jgi:hypothetical protein